MRILHFTLGLGGGGRERRMIQLIRGLYQQCDCEQMVVTLNSHCDYPEIYETPVIIEEIPYRPRKLFMHKMEGIIKSFHPDIVHSWVGSRQDLIILPLLKLKYHFKYIVGHLADCVPDSTLDYLFCLPSYWSADAIISNSKLGLTAKNAERDNAYVIHNGFDFARFNKSIDKIAKRKELNIQEDAFIVCMCARFHKSKDWKSFIELAKLAQEKKSKVHFLAIGEGETLPVFQTLAQTYMLDNISFLGRRKDVEEILQISDASILFTNSALHAEGISNSLMEAMAAGLPTIATNSGGTPELITDMENGFLIEDGDYNNAWNIIEKLSYEVNLRTQIGNAAKKTIKTHFSLSGMTQQYLELYHEILK